MELSPPRAAGMRMPPGLYALLLYVLFLSVTDMLALPLYYLDANRFLPVAIALAAAAAVAAGLWLRPALSFQRLRCAPSFWLLAALLLITAAVRSLAPDMSHDVSMARVFWQTPGFADNVGENVFPAGFTFFSPLSDRCCYYPRLLLGYRLGTLWNAALLLLLFRQTTALYGRLLGERLTALRESLGRRGVAEPFWGAVQFMTGEEFFAFLSVTTFYILADLGTYMIDLTALPPLLWLLETVLLDGGEKRSPRQLLFTALVFGLVFALKMTNAVFLLPLLPVFLWQHRRSLRPGLFFRCLLVGALPAVPYLLYAWTSTGNPVYWAFNALFRSPYYPDENFRDWRWGPKGWKELLLWPLHLIFDPEERVSEISFLPQGYLLLGWLGGGLEALRCLRARRSSPLLMLFGFYAVFTLLWLSSTGYPRYAILCELLAAVLLCGAVVWLLESRRAASRGLALALLLALCAQGALNTVAAALNRYDWSWRSYISRDSMKTIYADNAAYLLRDRGLIGTREQRERVDVFLSTHICHNLMGLLDPEAPIVNGRYIVWDLAALKEAKGLDYPALYLGQVARAEAAGAGVYDLCTVSEYEKLCDFADLVGAEIVSLEEVEGYFIGGNRPLLVGYTLSGRKNSRTELAEETRLTLPQGTQSVRLSGLVCVPFNVLEDTGELLLRVSAGEETLLSLSVAQHGTAALDETLSVAELCARGPVTLVITGVTSEGTPGNIINFYADAR